MAVYVIGDLHLSFGCNKPMDIFGKKWEGHVERLREGFAHVTDEDTTVLAGDLSWGISLAEAREDFAFVDALPGRKLLLKGNHDYWWETAAKINRFFGENGFSTMQLLHNNAFAAQGAALCGTRGWFLDSDTSEDGEHNRKVYRRELLRLEKSLQEAARLGTDTRYCFLHYPPIYRAFICEEITELLARYKVDTCFYGHLHGPSHAAAFEGVHLGVQYRLIAADYLGFQPLRVC